MNISRAKNIKRRVPYTADLKKVKIDIGCGNDNTYTKKGWMGLDIYDFGQAFVWDFEEGLPLPDDSVDQIMCKHVLEHVDNPVNILNEFHRVLKKAGVGVVNIVVPDVSHPAAYEFTHPWQYNETTFENLEKEDITAYGAWPWHITSLVVNDRKEIHVKMCPKI